MRTLRQHGGALGVTGRCEGTRERRLDERRLRRPRLGRGERAFAGLDRCVEVELLRREVAQERQQLESERGRSILGRGCKCELDEAAAFGDALREREVPGERSQAAGDAGVGRFVSVREGGPEVVVLELEASDPRSPLGSAKGTVRGVRQRGEVLRVRFPGSREAAACRQGARAHSRAPCRAGHSVRRGSGTRP